MAALTLGQLAIVYLPGGGAALHTVLDTSVALTGGLITLLLWDASRRVSDTWSALLVMTFAIFAVGELVHVLAVLGWVGSGPTTDVLFRAGTWGPPAHVLPIGVGAALLFRHRDRSFSRTFGLAMALLACGLTALFQWIPRYNEPGLLGITRPTLVLVPPLWVAVGIAYWRLRRESELASVIALSAAIFVCAHIFILYSHSPNDQTSMAAHYGKLVGEVLLLFSLTQIGAADTTRRRQLEEQLRALNRELDERVQERTLQLHDSEDRASLIIGAALDAVVTIDQSGTISGWNPQAEAIFGWTRDEVLGRPVDQVIMPERFREAHRAGLERYLTTGEAKVLNQRIELAALHKGGAELAVELAITPIRGVDAVTFSAFIRDVTEHKSREEQLRQLQRMDAIGRLTGGVAHDFNNLLAVVYGNSEVLRDRIANDPDALEMTDDIMGAASRGAELVRRLLAFARMQHLEPEPVDLNARLSSIVGLLQRVIGEEVNLQVRTARGLWPAIIDPTQVDDALVNLAINARDAMPDGGSLTIESSNAHFDAEAAAHYGDIAAGEYVMLAVSDTGTGMSPETIRRAFEPFFTTKEEGKGTGLGLSQVFGWVKQSGGHIKIYSELEHGTTVKLYLPRAQTDIAAVPKAVEAATPRGEEMILVVEDNPNVRKTVIRQLHDLGYQTIEADCGARALEMAKDGTRFDLLLTDVIMPGGITGYNLADELRKARPDLRVLFTSGYTELAANGDKPRSDGLLSKPYRKLDLGRAIRMALDTSVAAGSEAA